MEPAAHIDRKRRSRRRKATRRRSSSHHVVNHSLAVIPVRLDQTPGEVFWTDSFSVDVSRSTVAFMIEAADRIPSQHLIAGANLAGQPRRFTMLAIRSQKATDGKLRIEACPVRDQQEDLLSSCNLKPRVDARRFQFVYSVSRDILSQWESLGVLRRYLVDRVLVCPTCKSIPTWRHACPKCGSARHSRDRLIHHFACAHVGLANTFQSVGNALACPKCRATQLIAGTDFEYMAGPLKCFDCQESGCQPTLGCLCHQCHRRFGPAEATEMDLYGYHVERLDLLALDAPPK